MDQEIQKPKLVINSLYKIFGKRPKAALSLLEMGRSKEEILEKTGQTVGLQAIDLEILEGEIFVIMGLSGSGKSTLLRCLNRLIPPTSGKILLDGIDIASLDEAALREIRRKKLGMVFQNFALLPHRSVVENVAFGLEVQEIPESERLEKARQTLEMVGLSGYEESMPDQLSGGMKQRVGLARALASDPDILLMDEAFSALDPIIRAGMQDELLDLQNALNKTIVFVTHDLDEALKLGNRIALMKDGRIIQVGTPEEILTAPADAYVAQFVAGVDMTRVLTAEGVMKPPEPTVWIESGPRVALKLMEEHGISSIFAVGKGKTLKGLIVVEDAVKAAKEKKSLAEILITGTPVAAPDTPVRDLIGTVATSQYPVAVVDACNRLRGVIIRGSLLGALAISGAPDEEEST
ncbi:glycine betaine/L-proline ABC transporter, ATPase subunit [Methanofollis liminatans DSM 4140]|uniref:Glycine betaine/L-proline ABC transporter, ATPase subunit n=1 Tax=Methanofollis liminatans DSM 4140 TaxID=28892 RepID=J0RZX7_9EURY|nr:glycine betaine/L-proline ABC transporter ATP-binding protein [Methanofollis liminatans]EJG07146.1 glycine betaine/L-proline ABC transporter, ATPase subunit [Methanofollis liminatans DSM 4140]